MKSIKKMFILSLLAFSLVATGCDSLFNKPEETTQDYTDPDTGAKVHEEVTESKKEKVTKKEVTEKDGTVIISTETDDYETDITTYVEDTTAKDYTKHLESKSEQKPDETGIERITTKTESTQTFTDDSEGDVKEIKVEKTEIDGSVDKGAITDQTITTTKKDGTVIEEKSYTEGYTGKSESTITTTNKDGSGSVETKKDTPRDGTDKYGRPLSPLHTEEIITTDKSGNPTDKSTLVYDVDTAITNTEEYKYEGGKWVLTKKVEKDEMGGTKEKTTVPQSDGTSKISIIFKDGDKTIGEGEGTIDKDGTESIDSEFTNGAVETTVTDKDGNITLGAYIPAFQGGGNKPCYIYTEVKKGVVTYKSCEILYEGVEEGDTTRNVIFKTVYTNTDGTKSYKVNRFGATLGVYRNVSIYVPDFAATDTLKGGKVIYTSEKLRKIEAGFFDDHSEPNKFSYYYNDGDKGWIDHFYEDDPNMDPEDLFFTPAEPPAEPPLEE